MSGKKGKITIYTKYCAECMWPKEMAAIIKYTQHFGIKLKIKRTTYRPSLHKQASEIYGDEEYKVFVLVGGEVMGIQNFAKDCEHALAEIRKRGEWKKENDETNTEAS